MDGCKTKIALFSRLHIWRLLCPHIVVSYRIKINSLHRLDIVNNFYMRRRIRTDIFCRFFFYFSEHFFATSELFFRTIS